MRLCPKWLKTIVARLSRITIGYPLTGLATFFVTGILFWGGFNWSMELTNTESFCVSCHEMRDFVFKDYVKSTHYANRTGVRASCPDCHVPREWGHKVIRKIQATNELFHWVAGSIDTPAKFEAKRGKLARTVWAAMKSTDSRECRNCHRNDFMEGSVQSPKAEIFHALAVNWEMTCIDCHQGITHTLPAGFDKETLMDRLHDRMETDKVNCESCHEKTAGGSKDDGWD